MCFCCRGIIGNSRQELPLETRTLLKTHCIPPASSCFLFITTVVTRAACLLVFGVNVTVKWNLHLVLWKFSVKAGQGSENTLYPIFKLVRWLHLLILTIKNKLLPVKGEDALLILFSSTTILLPTNDWFFLQCAFHYYFQTKTPECTMSHFWLVKSWRGQKLKDCFMEE